MTETTALVLSGGASLGAVQVGMLQALAEHDVTADLVIGTSAGAVNSGWIAGDPGLQHVQELADIWRSLRTRDIFPFRPLLGFLGFVGRRNFLVSPTRLRALVARHLRFTRLEDAPVPIHLVATEVTTGVEFLLSRGDAVDAIAASAAVPGVFPPVHVEGRAFMDGGVANNTAISHAFELGADRIYVLPAGFACQLEGPPRRALSLALHAITLLLQQRLISDVARHRGDVRLHVVPPLCPVSVSPADFSHADTLIDRAYISTSHWLDQPETSSLQLEVLDLHGHR
jgi:NTE family protein